MASATKWKALPCCERHTDLTTWPWLSVEGPRTGGACGHQFAPEDAHLIAAAPDLLAACESFINANRSEHLIVRLNDEEMAAVEAIKSAIALARKGGEA